MPPADLRPILLVSPDGMLGRAFEALFHERSLAFTGVSWPAFDLTKPETVEPFFRASADDQPARGEAAGTQPSAAVATAGEGAHRDQDARHGGPPRTVVNCSAFTDVDGAETREAEATAINGDGVGLLARLCRRSGAVLVHFSTDYVFDGRASEPYAVDHPISPVNAYGRSKAAGEEAIRASGCEHLIVRTSWLYAPWAKNFVRTMLALGREKDSLRVVGDQVGRPTSAQYLAARSLALLEAGARGTFHATDGGSCSWHELASYVIARSGSRCRVEPCTSEEFVRPATRPAYSILDLTQTEALLGPSRPWQDNVDDVLREAGALAG